MMACSMCSSRGLNRGINANFARDVTLKRRRGQSYVGLVILACSTELVHKIIDGPSYIANLIQLHFSWENIEINILCCMSDLPEN